MEYFRERFDEYLNENWPVQISTFTFESAEVFKTQSERDYEASFTEWVQQEQQKARDRTREFLQATGCLERFDALSDRLATQNVLPFIGAGMSVASGYLTWGRFIESLLVDAPHAKETVRSLIQSNQFEEAAQAAQRELSPDVFSEEIRNRLGSKRQILSGPVLLLPHVFENEVLTTNFDYVISRAYKDADRSFVSEISGAALREAPNRLGTDPHCLLRLHGEAGSDVGRILTLEEYEATYTEDRTLSALLSEISGPRSFLFLGCSLRADRTLAALKTIKANSPLGRPPHYAILPLEPDESRAARRRELAGAGIHPIYYPSEDHDQCIEDILLSLMEETQ